MKCEAEFDCVIGGTKVIVSGGVDENREPWFTIRFDSSGQEATTILRGDFTRLRDAVDKVLKFCGEGESC